MNTGQPHEWYEQDAPHLLLALTQILEIITKIFRGGKMRSVYIVILLCAGGVPSIGANGSTSGDLDTQIVYCCKKLGIENPGILYQFGEARDKYNNCYEDMKTSITETIPYEAVKVVVDTFGTKSNPQEVKSVLQAFKNGKWTAAMVDPFVRNVYFDDGDKAEFLHQVTSYLTAEEWTPVIEYLDRTDRSMFPAIKTLVLDRQYKSSFDLYFEWTRTSNGHCPVVYMKLLFPYLTEKLKQLQADKKELFKIFNVICTYGGNTHISVDRVSWFWMELEVVLPVAEVRRASVEDCALFLAYGHPVAAAVGRVKVAAAGDLGWTIAETFAELLRCGREAMLAEARLMGGAIDMRVRKSAYRKLAEAAKQRKCDGAQFSAFMSGLGYQGLSPDLKLDPTASDELLVDFLVNAFLYQSAGRLSIRDVLIKCVRQYKIESTNKFMKIAIEKIFTIEALALFLAATNNHSANEVEEMMMLYIHKLELIDKEIWRSVLSLNRKTACTDKIEPYDIFKINREMVETNCGRTALKAIKYFLNSKDLRCCPLAVVESVAKYSAAINYEIKEGEFYEMYKIACNKEISIAAPATLINQSAESNERPVPSAVIARLKKQT